MATRMDALKAAVVVSLASLVSGDAKIRESADDFGKDRSLYPQYTMNDEPLIHPPMNNNQPDESWYDIPDLWNGGEVMLETKAGKEKHGNEGGSSGWWQPGSSGKSSKTHFEPQASDWWQPVSSSKTEKMQHEVEGSDWSQPGSSGKSSKTHYEAEASGWGKSETTHPTEASGWWPSGSGKSDKAKSAKATSLKHNPGGDWWGSIPTTFWPTTNTDTTTTVATTPAAKGDKTEDDDALFHTNTTSIWWAAPGGTKSHKSGKSVKAAKSGKSAKAGEKGWDSTWTPPSPCGKAEDCEQTAPGGGEHTVPAVPPKVPAPVPAPLPFSVSVSPATMSPVAPLVPVTMAPVVGQTRVAGTSSPTTIIDALTSEAGWFQSGKGLKTEELAYKRERVEGLAKQMEWKNSSSRPQVYSYLAICAAAGLYYILC